MPSYSKKIKDPLIVQKESFYRKTAPAIANAICNAVGVRTRDLPITPEKILAAMRKKKKLITQNL